MAEGRDRANKRLLAEGVAYVAQMMGAKRARADHFDPYARRSVRVDRPRPKPDVGWKDFVGILKERVDKHGGNLRH